MEKQAVNILLVEDDEAHAELVLRSFKAQKGTTQFMVANSLREARDSITGSEPDLVITDLYLPDGKGIELLDLGMGNHHFPLVVMTSHGDEQAAVEAMKAGALDYVVKSEATLSDMPHIAERVLREWGNIIERKRAEDELAKVQALLNAAHEQSPLGVIIADTVESTIKAVNEAAQDIFGIKDEPTKDISLTDYEPSWKSFRPDGTVYESLNEAPLGRAISGEMVKNEEMLIVRKDGTERSVLSSGAPIRDDKGEVVACITIYADVTEQKHLEIQLQRAQRMEAIATLAGGIAHEFNNALSGVIGNIELLKMDLPYDENVRKYAEIMKISTHRMANLTNQLLAYAQGGKYQPKNIPIDTIVKNTVPIIQHGIDPAIKVETDLPADISNVEVDLTQMQMVLSAVLNNSAEAMDGKGRIRITAGDKELDEEFTRYHPGLKPGDYVCLTIEDNGKGMDEETKKRVFDPFFTTKFQGRGLAMAAAYGIVRNHDGWISLYSELGRGTVTCIFLPAVKVEEKEGKKPKTKLVKGTGTILVIEDEEIIMDVCRAMLEKLGYRVLEAKTGIKAIDIVKTFDGDIDLVILDIVLPDMNGEKVYPFLMKARPSLKVLVSSGYSIDGPAQNILDAGAQGFIQKPFSILALSERLGELLEGK
jgi:PAS domain S-box-containing protein